MFTAAPFDVQMRQESDLKRVRASRESGKRKTKDGPLDVCSCVFLEECNFLVTEL